MEFKVGDRRSDGGGYSYQHSLSASGYGGEVVMEREREIWLGGIGGGGGREVETTTMTDPINNNNNSPSDLFYTTSALDFIPPLPNFPCMSSSSSSSTTPTPFKPLHTAFISTTSSAASSSLSSSSSATSSSASSSAGSSLVVFRSDNEFDEHNNNLESHLDHVQNIDVSYHHCYNEQQHQIKSDGGGGGEITHLQSCWDDAGQISHQGSDFHHKHEVSAVNSNRNNIHGEVAVTRKEEGDDSEMMMNIEDVVECMNVMDDFDTMGLSLSQLMDESNEIWDPTPLFESNETTAQPTNQNQLQQQQESQLFQHQQQQIEDLHVQTNQTPTTCIGEEDESHQPFLFLEDEDEEDEDHSIGGAPKRSRFSPEMINHVDGMPSGDDLAVVFFEWLKSNKELSISAEDLRSIKIKKSTIECAAKRLGGGKEGMKQLLKLVLQWVQNHHLQNKRLKSSSVDVEELITNSLPSNQQPQQKLVNSNNNNSVNFPNNPHLITQQPTDLTPTPPNCFNPPQSWPAATQQQPLPPPPYVSDHMRAASHMGQGFSSMVNYMNTPADPYHLNNSTHQYPHQMVDTTANVSSWPQPPPTYPTMMPPMPHYNHPMVPDPAHFSGYGPAAAATQYPSPYQFFPGLGDGTVRIGSSATKEARKKRMARQRRVFTHHHHRSSSSHHHQQQSQQQQNAQMMIRGGGGGGAGMMMSDGGGVHNSSARGWVYWQHNSRSGGGGGGGGVPPNAAMVNPAVGQMMHHQQQQKTPSPEVDRPSVQRWNGSGNSNKQAGETDNKSKLQGSKTEKNLKFLLQKVLKQSDVGNLGRIVLPKKEAETHLPELDARDGIPIAMEDIGTSRVWNMRYRFWPNNKSRMYLLENTGDFVRSNGLQEGDFIVIYSDVKCGKYMIRGVKVRTPQGPKSDPNKKQLIKPQKFETSTAPIAGIMC